MRSILPVAIAALAGVIPLAASAQRATVARSGNDQSVRVGRAVVARPFGAELVDRLAVVGSYQLRGRRTYLVRGDAGGQCPSRFVFVTEAARAAPIVSTPFGTCRGDARVRSSAGLLTVTMSSAADPRATARFAFDGASVRSLDAAADAAAQPPCPVASYIDPALQAATIEAFETDFPAEYRSRRALDRTTLDPQELQAVVTTLACFAAWPSADRSIPRLATPLFASNQGTAAFAALTAIAEDPSSGAHLRASARSFAAEMSYAVARRKAETWTAG